MSKPTYLLSSTRSEGRVSTWGFTLVELLVSMTILIIIVVLFAQVVQSTTFSIQRSTKAMDTSDLSSIAMDRLGNSISGMISSGNATLVVIKNLTGSDGVALITNGRVRNRLTSPNINVANSTDIRMGARGYCVIPSVDSAFPGVTSGGNTTYPSVPMLNWGDGTVTWTVQTNTNVEGNLLKALFQGTIDIAGQINPSGAIPQMLQFEVVNPGIFRFEVSFLLSDGSIINTAYNNGSISQSTPPLNKNFITGGIAPTIFPGTISNLPVYPIAFNANDSNYPAQSGPGGKPLYVRALIIAIASLDTPTRAQIGADQMSTLTSIDVLPKASDKTATANGKTPLETWDISDSTKTTYKALQSKFPKSVLQNIRFYQRYYYVN